MRILFTGATSLQIKPPENRRGAIKKIDVPKMVFDTLVKQGHDVDWRRTEVGEDLSGYEMIFCGFSGVLSLNAKPGALGMLWALSHGREIPTAVFIDDWQTRSNFSHARTLSNKRHYLSKPFGEGLYFNSDPQEDIQRHADVLLETSRLLGNEWPREWFAVCPMYSWGDHAKVLKEIPAQPGRITYLDPSPYIVDDVLEVMNHEPVGEGKQWNEWTLPALMPHADWVERIGVQWPVTYFGSRKLKAERLKTEADVIMQVARREGLLSPKYHHTGSGWWRSRFIYAAATGIVLGADPTEAGVALGAPYQLTPREIEELQDGQRGELATAQAEALFPRLWTHENWDHAVESLPGWITSAG